MFSYTFYKYFYYINIYNFVNEVHEYINFLDLIIWFGVLMRDNKFLNVSI